MDDNSDYLVLTQAQLSEVREFQKELHLCPDLEVYERCAAKRDELLDQHAEVTILVAAYQQVMSTYCAHLKSVFTLCAQTDSETHQTLDIHEASESPDDPMLRHWRSFSDIADHGYKIKSDCLGALRTVAKCWGREVVMHYGWASKGEKYCNVLRTAALHVRSWPTAVQRLNQIMMHRHRAIKASIIKNHRNPIEQIDLQRLAKDQHSEQSLLSPPGAFGYDKFGLLVQSNFADPSSTMAVCCTKESAHCQPMLQLQPSSSQEPSCSQELSPQFPLQQSPPPESSLTQSCSTQSSPRGSSPSNTSALTPSPSELSLPVSPTRSSSPEPS
ncbi:hypothetical protein QBC35DRAFT_510393, partial [Podospora australis]